MYPDIFIVNICSFKTDITVFCQYTIWLDERIKRDGLTRRFSVPNATSSRRLKTPSGEPRDTCRRRIWKLSRLRVSFYSFVLMYHNFHFRYAGAVAYQRRTQLVYCAVHIHSVFRYIHSGYIWIHYVCVYYNILTVYVSDKPLPLRIFNENHDTWGRNCKTKRLDEMLFRSRVGTYLAAHRWVLRAAARKWHSACWTVSLNRLG